MSVPIASDPYYKYPPLAERHIRLLKIHDPWIDLLPGERPDIFGMVQVTFEDYEISSCPPYIALSYTWGEPTQIADPKLRMFTKEPRCYPVVCQGKLIRGTRNLRDGLIHLRLMQNQRHIAPELYFSAEKETWAELGGGKPEMYWIDALCINQEDPNERSA